jgi:hypothetical protein
LPGQFLLVPHYRPTQYHTTLNLRLFFNQLPGAVRADTGLAFG